MGMVLQYLKGSLFPRYSDREYISGIYSAVRCDNFNFHVWSCLALLVLSKELLALCYCIFYRTHEHEGSFRILVNSAVEDHVKSSYCILYRYQCAGDIGKL